MDGQVKIIEACGVDEGREAEMREDRKDNRPAWKHHTKEEWAREQYIVNSLGAHAV